MLWIADYLAVIVSQFQNPMRWIRIIFLILVLGLLLIDLWGRYLVKRKSPEDYLYGRLRDGYINYWYSYGTEGLSEQEILFQKRLRDAGVDWILEYCLIHSSDSFLVNKKPEFSHIKQVAAAWAGYIQGVREWTIYRWIVELQDGKYLYLRGWFDPSGYEMRTSLFVWSANTAEEAALIEIQPEILRRRGFRKSKGDVITDQEVHQSLLDQIRSGERDWAGFKWNTDYAA